MRNIFGIYVKGEERVQEPTETPATENTVLPKYETNKSNELMNESKEKYPNSSGIYSKKYYFPSREYEGRRPSTSRDK